MPYRKPPSKAEMTAFKKAQQKVKTEPERKKIRDAFRKKHDFYATGAKAKVERDDEKSRAFGAFQIAEIRQLVKAHNRINDLVLPRKLNKKQMIDLIYTEIVLLLYLIATTILLGDKYLTLYFLYSFNP